MIKYITVCGIELPGVVEDQTYPIVFYKVTEGWDEFLRNSNPFSVTTEQYQDQDFLKKIAIAINTMYKTNGIGLAANQIGDKFNWCIIDTEWTKTGVKAPRVIINPNPQTSYLVETQKPSHEGCLSVPLGFKGDVLRHSAVSLDYTNLKGEPETWNAVDLDACAVMHELDHLRGELFIDYLSRLRLSFLENKLKKVKKTVIYKVKNHNKQIIAQVKKLNQMAAFGYRPKEETPLQPETVELPDALFEHDNE